ncbi:MAG: hypothetical protein IT521_05455 [Burkholderiales bacterium]|nr:hypothetical protein [Burkholderiales bacterium]
MIRTFISTLLALAMALAAAGCTVRSLLDKPPEYSTSTKWQTDQALQDRILALDPEHVREADVRQTLIHGPTPRIMLVHGGIFPVHRAMISFGRFLVGMGYPESRIREPYDGDWSHSPYEDAARLAGIVAWYYERDGMPPMLIGHSQGGMQVVKVLYVLNGDYGAEVPVWNPLTDFAENRTTLIDPFTGRKVPVVGGFEVTYASAAGAGGAAFLLPNQWSLIGKLNEIPDTVEDFTGYDLEFDLWAWTINSKKHGDRYHNHGSVRVRTVTLPASINHVLIPVTDDMLDNPAALAWIDAYTPGTAVAPPADASDNILWAADVWYSIKKYWVIEAQRLIRAWRAGARPAVPAS